MVEMLTGCLFAGIIITAMNTFINEFFLCLFCYLIVRRVFFALNILHAYSRAVYILIYLFFGLIKLIAFIVRRCCVI